MKLVANKIEVSEKKINDINVNYLASNALYIDQDNNVWGNKTFVKNINMENDIIVNGLVDSVNTSELVLLNADQVIYGQKEFNGNLFFDARNSKMKNLAIRGLVNGINISRADLLTVREKQYINGKYSFKEDIQLENNLTTKNINEVDLSKFYDEAVLINADQNISGSKHFQNNLKIQGNLEMLDGAMIDGVDASLLRKNILSRNKDQYLKTSFDFKSNASFVNDLKIDGLLNNINISKDVVYLSRGQNISGEKTFLEDLTAHGDIAVAGLINGINILGK